MFKETLKQLFCWHFWKPIAYKEHITNDGYGVEKWAYKYECTKCHKTKVIKGPPI